MNELTQLLLPPILTPLARMDRGKTSETRIHATGPKIRLVSLVNYKNAGTTHPRSRQS